MNNRLFQDIENRSIFINDNLNIMQKMDDNVIDLIYLDPPFGNMLTWKATNQKKINEIKDHFLQFQKGLFPNEDFEEVFKNVEFDDTWKETDINISWQESIIDYDEKLFTFIDNIDFVIKGGKYYLFYMAIRLIEMKRILKETGSLYMHCDNTMGHYLKGIIDIIFGYDNFRNEIVWHYRRWTAVSKRFQKLHDTVFFYVKDKQKYIFNDIYTSYTEGSKERKEQGVLNRFTKGEKYHVSYKNLDQKGVRENDVWHIPYIPPSSKERIGYPTQKPLALLERIIKASSNKGDIVLDPFCGCATTLIASETLNRKWIGIDKNKQAFYMNYYRMRIKLERIVETKNVDLTFFGEDITTLKQKKDVSSILMNYFKSYREDLPTMIDKEKNEIINQKIKDSKLIDEKYKKDLEEESRILKGNQKSEFRENLRKQQNNTCKICKTILYDAFHLDRITPGSMGGKYINDNLQILCTRCNLSKNKHTNIDLIKKLFKKNKIDEDVYRLNIHREWKDKRIAGEEKERLLKDSTVSRI